MNYIIRLMIAGLLLFGVVFAASYYTETPENRNGIVLSTILMLGIMRDLRGEK